MNRPGELSGEPILCTRSPFNYMHTYLKNTGTFMFIQSTVRTW